MGDLIQFTSKEHQMTLDKIEMYRLLYLYEIVTYLRELNENQDTHLEQNTALILKNLPLVQEEHYRFIAKNLTLPEDILGEK